MNELEYIQCNVYIIQGTTFNIVSLSLYAYQCQLLSPHALSAQCTPSMFCSFDEHCANVSIMSVAATFPPWFDVKSSPPLNFFWSICSKLSMV